MGYKRFLLIPVIFLIAIFLYSSVINSLTYTGGTVRDISKNEKSNTGEVIGVGQTVTVKVTRATSSYLFGLVELPEYAQGVGNLTTIHNIFFWSLYASIPILITIFILIDRRYPHMAKVQWNNPPEKNIWLKIGRSLGIGALFTLIAFLVSGDSSSLPLGLLVAYLEFRMTS